MSAAELAGRLAELPRREVKRLWAELGYIVLPADPEWHDRPTTPLQTKRLLAAMTGALDADLAAAGIASPDTAGLVRDFWDLVDKNPVKAKKGGNGVNGALQLYAVTRLTAPAVIIESGVFRGQTSWVLRQAAPHAAMFCFDVDFSPLVYRDREAIYHQGDWSEVDLAGLDGARTLCVFDDHIDHGRRVEEAAARGLTTVLFDDDAPAHRIHTVGGPPVPTIAMLMDETLDGETLRWRYRGREYAVTIDPARARAVRAKIAAASPFADLGRVTGYTPARITFVRLAR